MGRQKKPKEKPTKQENIVSILTAVTACATLAFNMFVGSEEIETRPWLHSVQLALTFTTTACAVALAYLVLKKKKNGRKIEENNKK